MKKNRLFILIFIALAAGFVFWYKFIRTVGNLENENLIVKNPYEAMARATGGQVLHFDKSNTGPDQTAQMTALALQSLKEKDYAMLWRAEGVSGHTATEFSFDVDSSISELSVFVSGISSRPEFSLLNQSKSEVAPSSILTADQSTTKIFLAPAPGQWRLRILKSDNISVYVRAKSDIDVSSIGPVQTGGRPGHEGFYPYTGPLSAGSMQKFTAELGPQGQGAVDGSLEAISVDGRSLAKVDVKGNGSSTLVGEIKIPKESFRFSVSWKNQQGQTFRRMDEKTFELSQLERVNFKLERNEAENSAVCKTASYLGTYLDTATNASMMLMCVNNSGVVSSQIAFSLPLESDIKLKTFRLVSPDYVKMNLEDCNLAAKSFSSFPKVIEKSDGKKVEFAFSCQQDAGGFRGVIGVKATQL
jgi:hypothetical protein